MKDTQLQKVMLDLLNEHVRLTNNNCKITIALEDDTILKKGAMDAPINENKTCGTSPFFPLGFKPSQIKLLLEQKDATEKLCSVLQKRIVDFVNDL